MNSNVRRAGVQAIHEATAIYTSEGVVDELLNRAEWPQRGGRLLDPGAGDGSFLLRALRRIPLPVDCVSATDVVRGCEIHPGAAKAARTRIAEYLVTQGWSAGPARAAARRMVSIGDFLADKPMAGEFRVIAGNPPYLRFGHLPEFFKQVYRRAVPAHALADLQHGFLQRCADILPPDGCVGFVMSDRVMINETAAKLRASIGQKLGLIYLGRIDPATSFYRPKIRRKGSPPRIHPIMAVMCPRSDKTRLIGPSAICPDYLDEEEHTGPTLADVADVRLAPWLGPAGRFVIGADIAKRLKGRTDRNVTLLPAVDTDDLDPATDVLRAPSRFAIRTSRDHEPRGRVRAHLRKSMRSGLPKRCQNRPYWLPPELIKMDLSKPSLLIPRIARRLRTVILPAGILPVNHNLSVVSNGSGFTLDELQRILTSEASQRWIAKHAPRLENGFYSITTKLLRRLPVPVTTLEQPPGAQFASQERRAA